MQATFVRVFIALVVFAAATGSFVVGGSAFREDLPQVGSAFFILCAVFLFLLFSMLDHSKDFFSSQTTS